MRLRRQLSPTYPPCANNQHPNPQTYYFPVPMFATHPRCHPATPAAATCCRSPAASASAASRAAWCCEPKCWYSLTWGVEAGGLHSGGEEGQGPGQGATWRCSQGATWRCSQEQWGQGQRGGGGRGGEGQGGAGGQRHGGVLKGRVHVCVGGTQPGTRGRAAVSAQHLTHACTHTQAHAPGATSARRRPLWPFPAPALACEVEGVDVLCFRWCQVVKVGCLTRKG